MEWRTSAEGSEGLAPAAPSHSIPGNEESTEAGPWLQPGSSAIKNKVSQQRLHVSLNRTTLRGQTWPTLGQTLDSVLSYMGSETTDSELYAEKRVVFFLRISMDVPIISIISIKEILLFSTGTVRYSGRDLLFMWFPVTAWKCRAS